MTSLQSICRRMTDKQQTYANCAKQIVYLPITDILSNIDKPRRYYDEEAIFKLADSIRAYGIWQPVLVRPCIGMDGFNRRRHYEVIDGERRIRAAKICTLRAVPCIIVPCDGKEAAELSFVLNLHDASLHYLDAANAIRHMMESYGISKEYISRISGINLASINRKIRFLRFTPAEERLLIEHGFSESYAALLLKVSDPHMRLSIIRTIMEKDWTQSQTEEFIDKQLFDDTPEEPTPPQPKILLRDIRLFYNTLERAIHLMEKAGVNVDSQRIENDDMVEFHIVIDKHYFS